eukprot:1158807-Pelagomonas_calceolata.AAC.2
MQEENRALMATYFNVNLHAIAAADADNAAAAAATAAAAAAAAHILDWMTGSCTTSSYMTLPLSPSCCSRSMRNWDVMSGSMSGAR